MNMKVADTFLPMADPEPGTSGRDNIRVTVDLLEGATLDGGGDIDTLTLDEGGEFDLRTVDTFANIEFIKCGGADDTLVMNVEQLDGVFTIEGGGDDSKLFLHGDEFDLTGLVIKDFGEIHLEAATWGVEADVSDKDTAFLLHLHGEGAKSLTLRGDVFSEDERKQLFERGVTTIIDDDGMYENKLPELQNLPEAVMVAPAGSVILDADGDALVEDDGETLASLSVDLSSLSGDAETDSIGITSNNIVELLGEMEIDTEIEVDGVVIGTITNLTATGFFITFNAQATQDRVSELLRVISYKNTSTDTEYVGQCAVTITVTDRGQQSSSVMTTVSVAPVDALALTENEDHLTGTVADEMFIADSLTFTEDDVIDGGDGTDIFQSRGGDFDLRSAGKLSNFEILRGSKTAADAITLDAESAGWFSTIDGGGDISENTLFLSGAGIDLRGKTVQNFQSITLDSDTDVTLDNKDIILHLQGHLSTNDHVILEGDVFTEEERNKLLEQGIDQITDDSGTYSNDVLAVSDLNGDVIRTFSGRVVLIDAGSNARISGVVPLASLLVEITLGYKDSVDSLGLDLSGRVSLSNGLRIGSDVLVGETVVGTFVWAENAGFEIEFGPDATRDLVQDVLRALTYRNGNPESTLLNAHEVSITLTGLDGQEVVSKTTIEQYVYQKPSQILLDRSDVNEASVNGTVVGTLRAIDPDLGVQDTFTYTLLSDAGGRFALQGDRLVVANGSKLDFEQAQSYSVMVRVTDKAGLTHDQLLTITVGDVANERAVGSPDNDLLIGGSGRDTLDGGLGNDTLNGGFGSDELTGGAGGDVFNFKDKLSAKENLDRIADFKPREDKLWLDNAIFKKLGKAGSEMAPAKLNKKYFKIGTQAEDKDDYLVYNKKTGILSYDADGSGKGKAVAFAQLPKNLKLSAADFFVI
ncbi:cadherin domain-containing protein [Microvirga sp. 2YAF29]|uniref:cadherin repeat domain-containing protein n=1 Tax=Microvirga sp. 2YAF29 TaxID=3233031 RepID=UPI003F9527D3